MPAHITYLKWDSEFFGFKVGKVTGSYDFAHLQNIRAQLKKNNFSLAYWKINVFDSASIEAAKKMQIFLADTKIIYSIPVHDFVLNSQNLFNTQAYAGKVNEELVMLAMQSGEHSRFKADKNFSPGIFEKMYGEWMKKSLTRELADEVFIVTHNEKITGMITVVKNGMRAQIGLLAVAEAHKKKGTGKALVHAAINWAKKNKYEIVQVVTQKTNIAACKFYESCGFKIESEELIYHIWL